MYLSTAVTRYSVSSIARAVQTAHACRDGHTSHDGRDSRCESSGYESCGENVAYNAPPQLDVTVPKTHLNWMDEAEHRDNILNSDFSRVGYGWYVCKEVGEDGSGSVFWTAFFGKP